MRETILKALQKATGESTVNLEFPENDSFGDYSTNIAMVSGKKAEEILEKLKKDKNLASLIAKIEVKGPGFINFYLSESSLVEELGKIRQEKDKYGRGKAKGEAVVVDYSSPNIAKRFSIGHLRSTVIGQALYNLYAFLGYKVIGDNHLGDWGTQFGSLLAEIKDSKLEAKDLTVDKLEELYVEFNRKAEADPKLWDEARGWFKKLEDGDKEARETWKTLVDISMAEFDRIYNLLGVKIDYAYGESFYEDYMPKVIDLVREKGFAKKSKGAEIVEFSDLPPAMLVKSDGATTYFTRDLATIFFRIKSWDPKLIIYEVGSEQTLHFRQVFEAARLLGWAEGRNFVHIGHGLIRFEHGKMSTRKGETVKLEDVLNEAINRARKIKDDEKIAKAVGIGAVKYFDLMHHPATDIIFDWEKMFVLEGNSAPYLQYTFARTNSVLEKAQGNNPGKKEFNPEELAVLRSLVRFPEVVGIAAKSFSPNLLCNYLFDLASRYNNFYNLHRIIGGDNERFRLELTEGTNRILKMGLQILGIETPEKM